MKSAAHLEATIQGLREELEENRALREKLADILSRTAVALRGPEPPLTRWSWHDLPELAASKVTEAAGRGRCNTLADALQECLQVLQTLQCEDFEDGGAALKHLIDRSALLVYEVKRPVAATTKET